jgi:CxC2 like cysteine cluster associated with KDZ transposases
MREYLDKRKFYLARILAAEAPPIQMLCSGCGSSGEWRCLDCFGRPLFCKDCCQNAHRNNPFHKVQQWEKEYFKDSTLRQANLTLHFGHGGKPCDSIHCDDFHQDEGEDEQMFGLPDLPSELLDDDDAEIGSVPFTQMELDDDGSLLERDVRDKSTYAKNVLVIIHSNGVHHLPVQWCRCPGHLPDDIQALDLHFFPASFKQVKTLFTFEGLDSFLAENQECKSSAWHYYQKLRRFTSACYPETIPVSPNLTSSKNIHPDANIHLIPKDRYRELLRCTRQFRNIKHLKWHGFGHSIESPGLGDLAVLCPACPQVGVNLPEDWKNDEEQ